MAVGSAGMEPYRSTLAVAALAVLGLVAAARVLHPGNFEDRPARVAVASTDAPAAAVTWVDPPADLPGAPKAAPSPDVATLLDPRISVALPPGATMARPLASEMTSPSVPVRQAAAAPRRRTARRSVRARQVASVPATTTAASGAAGEGSAVRQVRADPIGDLLRGLGLGRDG